MKKYPLVHTTEDLDLISGKTIPKGTELEFLGWIKDEDGKETDEARVWLNSFPLCGLTKSQITFT